VPTAPTKLNGSIPEPVQRGEAVVPIVNPKVLIDRVLVGYRMNPNKRDKLMAMLQTAGLEDRVEFEPKPYGNDWLGPRRSPSCSQCTCARTDRTAGGPDP
jgi:hypothetical protein